MNLQKWTIMKNKTTRVKYEIWWSKLIRWANTFNSKVWKVQWTLNSHRSKWVSPINKVPVKRRLLHLVGMGRFCCSKWKNKGWTRWVKKIGIPANPKSKISKRLWLILYLWIWLFHMLVILGWIWKVLKTSFQKTKGLVLRSNNFNRGTKALVVVAKSPQSEATLKEFKVASTVKA